MISGIFGLPGSGKSVYLAKCAKYALDGRPVRVGGHTLHHGDYDNVFTNFPVKGCKQLEWSRLGKVEIRNALLICDEIMMYADSRQYKNFSDDLTFFFAEHRKFNIDPLSGQVKHIVIVTYVFVILHNAFTSVNLLLSLETNSLLFLLLFLNLRFVMMTSKRDMNLLLSCNVVFATCQNTGIYMIPMNL